MKNILQYCRKLENILQYTGEFGHLLFGKPEVIRQSGKGGEKIGDPGVMQISGSVANVLIDVLDPLGDRFPGMLLDGFFISQLTHALSAARVAQEEQNAVGEV